MKGLEKTKKGLFARMGALFSRDLDDEFYDELEETLILADTGVETALYLVEQLRARVKAQKIRKAEDARALLVDITAEVMQNDGPPFETPLL